MTTKVLVLNKGWIPIDTTPMRKAVKSFYKGKAKAISIDYDSYDIESWSAAWGNGTLSIPDNTIEIITSNLRFPMPEVIQMNTDYRLKYKRVPYSRKHVYIRDDYTCQYCGEIFPTSELNLDHVIPDSKNGPTSWTNIVTSCKMCNSLKGDNTPSQAGMKLLRKPRHPHWTEIKWKQHCQIPDSWLHHLETIGWRIKVD